MSSAADLDLFAVRERLGGQVFDGGMRWIGPGPGHGPHDQSLSVRLCDGRVLVHSFSGDLFRECAAYLGLNRDRGAREDQDGVRARQRALRDAEKRDKHAFCERLWKGTTSIAGTAADLYLRNRGLPSVSVPDIRFHPRAPLGYQGGQTYPAMVCAVRDDTGRGRGLHVTAVTLDGEKAMKNPRRMFGECSKGGVMIGRVEAGEIAVAEGVESALSFHRIHGMGTLCRLSAGGVETYEPGSEISIVHNAMDDDKAGWKAADLLEKRIGRAVGVVRHNPGRGRDWNDALKEDYAS